MIDYLSLNKKWNLTPRGVVHVGAHYGEELKEYLEDLTLEKIVFFEANPSIYSVLRKNIDNTSKKKGSKLKSIVAYPEGLGAEEKEVEFHVASNGQSSSVLKPDLHSKQYPHITFDVVQKILLKPLDSYNLEEFDYLTIDVQGYELEVLKGASNTLKNIKCIFTEVNSAYLYENCVLVDELDKFLGNFGFKREDTCWCGDYGNWGDAFYIKR